MILKTHCSPKLHTIHSSPYNVKQTIICQLCSSTPAKDDDPPPSPSKNIINALVSYLTFTLYLHLEFISYLEKDKRCRHLLTLSDY